MRNKLQVVQHIILFTLVLATGLSNAGASDDMLASVMQVGVRHASGRLAIGSAVIIAPGILVTACHGTRDAVSVVLMHRGEQLPVNVQSEDIRHDLCILSAPSIRGPVALFDDHRRLSVGDEVIAAGFSKGYRLQASVGQVKALYNYDGAQVIRVSTPFSTGASGGGLFDRQGRLIGILSFKSTAGDDHHYAMPVDWLSQTNAPQAAADPESNESFWERAEQLQPYFLRGAWLEGKEDWGGLVSLAEQWTHAEPANVEAWISLARANGKLGRLKHAHEALRRGALLDPGHVEVQLLQNSNNIVAD